MKQWTTKTGVALTCISGEGLGRGLKRPGLVAVSQNQKRAWYSMPWIEQKLETTDTYEWSYLWVFGFEYETTKGFDNGSEQDDAV